MNNNVRMPAVAGLFYPLDATELSEQITNLLDSNKLDKKFNNILGIVVPHAGYIYSGKSAAIAYNVLKENNDFETAIILKQQLFCHQVITSILVAFQFLMAIFTELHLEMCQ